MTATTRTPEQIAEIDARLDRALGNAIDQINELLGGRKVSYGYIGNVERWGDDRSWRLFLPNGESRGDHATGDLDGKKAIVQCAHSILAGIRLARGL